MDNNDDDAIEMAFSKKKGMIEKFGQKKKPKIVNKIQLIGLKKLYYLNQASKKLLIRISYTRQRLDYQNSFYNIPQNSTVLSIWNF